MCYSVWVWDVIKSMDIVPSFDLNQSGLFGLSRLKHTLCDAMRAMYAWLRLSMSVVVCVGVRILCSKSSLHILIDTLLKILVNHLVISDKFVDLVPGDFKLIAFNSKDLYSNR